MECKARLSQQRQYCAFLTNQVSLPSLVLCELQRKELCIMTLFNEECHNLWLLLSTSFAYANKSSHSHSNPKLMSNNAQNKDTNEIVDKYSGSIYGNKS